MRGLNSGPEVHPHVRWVLSRQAGVSVVCGVVAAVVLGLDAAISAALGGGIGVLSGYAYIWRATRGSATDPKKILSAQTAGEGYKLAVTALLFALVFVGYSGVAALPLFLGYAATVVVYWLALLRWR